MKKIYLFLILLLGATSVGATYKAGYYDKMDGKQKEALKAAAKECVQNHTRLNYTDLPTYWQYTDVYPDLVNGSRRWWDMYSDNVYLIYSNQSARQSFSANKMQREHSVPKSWWKKDGDVEYTPAYSDMWNLYPSDGPANQAKLNYAFGETDSPKFNNGVTKVGPARTGLGGGSGNVFEPADEYKGDFARAIFYMATVYDDLDWVIPYMFRKQSWPTLQQWAVDMLLQWSRTDPVDQKEIDRNDGVESQQGNRNPFIDFPELAEYVWGTRTTETFYIKDQGGTVTPPIVGEAELIRPENGMALDFGETAVSQVSMRPLEIVARNLTSPLSLRITGADRSNFRIEVTSISAADLNTADVYKLNVYYAPKSEGVHTATLSLYDGGLSLGKDVAVTLQGQAFPIPTLTAVTALDATNVSDTQYTANWTEAAEVVDYYVVTRVRYTEDGPQASELVADSNSLLIEDRDADVTESYTVRSSRLGFLSPASNAITVAKSNSVVGIENTQPLALGHVEGGFVVLIDNPQTDMRIFDVSGRLVAEYAFVSGGDMIELPTGIYIVVTKENQSPLKTVVY